MPAETGNLPLTAIEAQALLASIVDSSDDAIISKDLQGRILSWNKAAEKLYGFTAKEIIGEPVTILIPTERLDEEPSIVERIQRGERIEHYETMRRHKDGSLIEVSLSVSPIRDQNGVVIGAAKIARDITAQRRAEFSARRLAAIVESSEDAIISKNLDGIIQSWNDAAVRLFGYTAEEAIGQSILMLIPEASRDEEPTIIGRIRLGGRVEHYETVRRHKNGTRVQVALTVSPIRNHRGEIVGASKIVRDITEKKRAELALEQAHEAAIAASRAKDDFLAALSHELRTPLNPVLLLASNGAEDQDLPDSVREDFLTIRKNVELEARLIDDLLDITRISRGKLSLQLGPQNVHHILEDALATVREDVANKKLCLKVSLQASQPKVLADPVRLQQVFWNLLKNAVKFTPDEGRIELRTSNDALNEFVTIEVADTGIGITEDERTRLFDAFSQGDHAEDGGSHRFGGLGLGLTISRLLTTMHNGSIQVASGGRGRGSTFTVNLPAIVTRPNAVGPASRPYADSNVIRTSLIEKTRARRLKILLVEDHIPTRDALLKLLIYRQFEVEIASDGAEAHARFDENDIDFLISDIGLPDINGYDLMNELCAKRRLPGIAITGYGMENDVARSQEAGFSRHLTKPVTVQALDQALMALIDELPA